MVARKPSIEQRDSAALHRGSPVTDVNKRYCDGSRDESSAKRSKTVR